MKKLISSLLVLGLLVPLVHAESLDPTDEDLHDYFDFETGDTWEYEVTTTNFMTEEVEGSVTVLTQEECDLYEDCFTHASDAGNRTTYAFEDETLYYKYLNGFELTQNYTRFSTSSFEEEMASEDYEAFNFAGADAGAINHCDTELVDDYEYENQSYLALRSTCEMSVVANGYTINATSVEVVLKGLGTVYNYALSQIGSSDYLEVTMQLTDTSRFVEISPFSDVSTNDKNYPAIEYLYQEGVFSGYEDGSFKPNNAVNRAELLKILVEGQGVTPDETIYANCFTDVTTDWYAKYVCYAEAEGWVSGYPDGTFKPADTVNKVEALKMLLLSQEVELLEGTGGIFEDVTATDWFVSYVETANSLGILEELGQFFYPDGDRDREGIAENLFRLLLNLQSANTAEALAQGTCDILTDGENIDEIMEEYGFDEASEIDDYILYIEDLEFFAEFQLEIEAQLELTCADALEEARVDVEELVNEMVGEE